jgi:uncharacterized protein (TIGR02271 family)
VANTKESMVVGVFDEYREARAAAQEISAEGITPEAVQMRSNMATGAAGRGSEYGTEQGTGGVSGFFHRLFGSNPEDREEAGHYAEAVRRGNTVLAVKAPVDKLDRVIEIMNKHNAIDIDRRVEEYRKTGYERFDEKAPAYTAEQASREREQFRGATQSIPVIEEEVKVGKRAVQRGAVRVYSHIVEEPVNETVHLHEERATIERRPVDRPLRPGEEAMMRDQNIEVVETAEEPVVSKSARVKEEVVVGKEGRERIEEIHDTVRHTEVKVEPNAARQEDRIAAFRRDYDTQYAKSGVPFETLRPAYEYGYEKASDARYRSRNWSDAESDLEKDYTRYRPNSKWKDVKGAVQRGWNTAKESEVRR